MTHRSKVWKRMLVATIFSALLLLSLKGLRFARDICVNLKDIARKKYGYGESCMLNCITFKLYLLSNTLDAWITKICRADCVNNWSDTQVYRIIYNSMLKMCWRLLNDFTLFSIKYHIA